MRKSFFLCFLFGSFTLVESASCTNPFEDVQKIADRDLSAMFVASPTELKAEGEKVAELLKTMEEEDLDEKMLDYIVPVCAGYRDKAREAAFDEFAGIDPAQMLKYQVAVSGYYNFCADAMSDLISVLLSKGLLK